MTTGDPIIAGKNEDEHTHPWSDITSTSNSVGPTQLQATSVSAGTYVCVNDITVDTDGRVTAITTGQ